MKSIIVNEKEQKLEFTFEAVEHKELVQKMFNVLTGAYLVKGNNAVESIIDGASEMVADIPHICITAFYAGLLENNPVSADEAKTLMKIYMKDNKLSFRSLFEELKACMENDGFFDLSGLTEMINEMNANAEKMTSQKKTPKAPQDYKKKSTSTK